MAISDSQKVDLLWKKVGFGKTKTDSNSAKKAPNEAITSDFIIKPSQIWALAANIPSVIPSSSSSIVTVYSDALSSSLETTEDATSTDNRTWKTGLTNWIPPGFGATYQLKVYAAPTGTANPQTNGEQLFETGSGNDDQWYFDYQSGVLHFIGNALPTAINSSSGNVIYVSGGKYVGSFGLSADATGAATTYRKSNLAAVYSDSNINEGDLIEVGDAGDGEYAVYLARVDGPTSTGDLTLISTRDSSGGDSATLSANVTYNGGATVTLGNVSSTSKAVSVMVDVTTTFDGSGATLTVGDDDDNSRLMSMNYLDISSTGVYVTNPSYIYQEEVDANNTIKVYVSASGSTQGAATVSIQYT